MANLSFSLNCSEFEKLISDNITKDIIKALMTGANFGVALCGVLANVLNLIVYARQGINDSISVLFMFLSASDLVSSSLAFALSGLCFFNEIRAYIMTFDPLSVFFTLAQTREKMYSISVLATTVISTERCLCVALPLQVRSMFTRSRSFKIIAFVAFFVLLFFLPEYLTGGFSWRHDPMFQSYVSLLGQRDRAVFEIVKDVLLSGILQVFAGTAAAMCTALMISAVKASKRLHKSQISNSCHGNSYGLGDSVKSAMSRKATRQIKTVVCVNIIFLICSIPQYVVLTISVVNYFILDYSLFVCRRYMNVLEVINAVAFTSETFNSAMNFLVYYACSSKFRRTLKQIVLGK